MKENGKIMGGEFALQALPADAKEYLPMFDATWFCSGRAALFHIVRHILQSRPTARFFLPDYLCVSVIEAVSEAGARVDFYALDECLRCDVDDLAAKCGEGDVVLLINFFGGIDCSEMIRRIRTVSEGLWVIVDEVQAFFDMYRSRIGAEADFVFTSFRKTLPLPDGSWAMSRHGVLKTPAGHNDFVGYKIAGGLLRQEAFRYLCGDTVLLSLSEKGEELLGHAYDAECSGFTRRGIGMMRLESFAAARRRNAAFVLDALADMGILPLLDFASDAVPLFVPVCLPNRDAVRRKLFEKRIFCPVHWPLGQYGERLKKGREMAAQELSLIIDHRYDLQDMDRMMQTVKRAL